MNDFVTVFEINRWSNGLLADELFRLAIGLVALVSGIGGAVHLVRKRSFKELLAPIFLTAWGVFWLTLHDFPRMYGQIANLADAYESGRYEVVEGDVTVLREQPAHGHTSGDRIVVGGKPFEVDYYLATPAYHDTIAHGGVLKAGVHARISHVDGNIVRVEV